MEKVLTKEQALAEGYEHFGYSDEGWQAMRDLSELEPSDFDERKGTVCLFEKEPSSSASISADDIIDLVEDRWIGETGSDDTSDISDALKAAGLDDFVKRANEQLQTVICYRLTDIQVKAFQ